MGGASRVPSEAESSSSQASAVTETEPSFAPGGLDTISEEQALSDELKAIDEQFVTLRERMPGHADAKDHVSSSSVSSDGVHTSQLDQLTSLVSALVSRDLAAQQRQAQPSAQPLPRGLTFPAPKEYSGAGRPDDFLLALNDTFALFKVTDDTQRIVYAANRMTDQAKTWYKYVRAPSTPFHEQVHTWAQFEASLKRNFQTLSASQDARNRLAKAYQRKDQSVQAYAAYLRILYMDIDDISEGDKLDRFTRGLSLEVRKDTLLRRPATFDAAVSIAVDLDIILKEAAAQERWSSRPTTSNAVPAPSVPAKPFVKPQHKHAQHHAGTRGSGQPIHKKLTEEEKVLYREKGWCTFCRAKDHVIRDCPKRPQSSNSKNWESASNSKVKT